MERIQISAEVCSKHADSVICLSMVVLMYLTKRSTINNYMIPAGIIQA